MKRHGRWIAAVCLVLACALAAGCTPVTGPDMTTLPTTSVPTTPPTTTAPVNVEFPLEEEVTLTLTADVLYRIKSGDISLQKALETNVLWQELYQRTNVKVEIQPLTESDVVAQLQEMLDSGNYGDIILFPAMDAQSMSRNIENGRFMRLDSYVNNRELMPNYNSRILDERPEARGMITSPDGHIYALGGGFSEMAGSMIHACWINKTWVELAGMTLEDISTLEGLEKFFEWVKTNDANGNGDTTDELPYGCCQLNNPIDELMGMWGLPIYKTSSQIMFLEDGVVKLVPLTQNYKGFLNTLKKWFDNGWCYENYWEYDGINSLSYAIWKDKYVNDNGEPERIAFWTGTDAPARNNGDSLPAGTEKCEYVCILPPKVDGYETRWFMSYAFMGSKGNIAVSSACKHPEIALAWLDLFYSQDVCERVECGEPGSAHRWEVDGKICFSGFSGRYNWETVGTDDSCLSQIIYNWPRSITEEEWLNRRIPNTNSGASDGVWAQERMRNRYMQYADCVNKEVLPSLNMTSGAIQEFNEIDESVKKLISEYQKEFLLGETDLTDGWVKFEAELKSAGVERMMELAQQAYDVFLDAMKSS